MTAEIKERQSTLALSVNGWRVDFRNPVSSRLVYKRQPGQ